MAHFPASRLSHSKTLKSKKLGFFTEQYLKILGKRDAKKETVRKDSNGFYTSPYIEKEINLCIVQIRAEQERLERILLPLQFEHSNHKRRIAKQNAIIECIKLHNNCEDTDINFITLDCVDEEGASDKFSDLLKKIQCDARLTSIHQQMGDLNASIEIIKVEDEQIDARIKEEKEVTKLRCLQAYNFLIARLFAYWNGVLSSNSTPTDPDFLPSFKMDYFAKINEILGEVD